MLGCHSTTRQDHALHQIAKDSVLHSTTAKLVYNDTLGATKMCCYNQVVVVTRTFSTETIESALAMCVVVRRLML